MKSELQLGVKFIGYSAFLVKPPTKPGDDRMLASIGLFTGELKVYGSDDGLAVRVDGGKNCKVISDGRNELTLGGNHELDVALADIIQNAETLEMVWAQIYEVGRKFKRIPYETHLSLIREACARGGAYPLQVHGFGIIKSGRLTMLEPEQVHATL